MTARRWRRGDGDSHGRHPTRRGHNEVGVDGVPQKDAEPRVRVRVARGFHPHDEDQARRVWEQLDENGNGKVSYPELSRAA